MSTELAFAEVIPPGGMMAGLLTAAERAEWDVDVAQALDAFNYETCGECGQDADMHRVSPDMFGKPHVWCLNVHEDVR